jgi:hypothetical protein
MAATAARNEFGGDCKRLQASLQNDFFMMQRNNIVCQTIA